MLYKDRVYVSEIYAAGTKHITAMPGVAEQQGNSFHAVWLLLDKLPHGLSLAVLGAAPFDVTWSPWTKGEKPETSAYSARVKIVGTTHLEAFCRVVNMHWG